MNDYLFRKRPDYHATRAAPHNGARCRLSLAGASAKVVHLCCAILAALTFFSITRTAYAGAGNRFKAWIDQQAEFPIGAWSYVSGQSKPQSWFDTYKAANMNMIQISTNQLTYTKAAGLNAVLGTWDYYFLPANSTAFQSAIDLANDSTNRITTFLLKDDLPAFSTANYDYYYEQYDAINLITNTRIYPDTPASVMVADNFLPNWAVATNRFGVPYWDLIDEGFLRCNPSQAAHSHYPMLLDGSRSPDYFQQLEGFRNRSYDVVGSTGPGLFAIVGLVSYNPGGDHPRPNRQVSLTDARLEVHSQLAYGAKGLWWYNYQRKPTGMEEFGDGFVDIYDNINSPLYNMCKEINRRTLNWGNTLKGLKSTNVSFVPNSAGGIPSGVQTYAFGDASTYFDVSGSGGICVAKLDWPWSSQWYYVLVTNMQHGANTYDQSIFTRTITCKFHKNLLNKRSVSVDDGLTYELSLPPAVGDWHTVDFTVEGGDAILFALKKP